MILNDQRPSMRWLDVFVARKNLLLVKSIREVEQERVRAQEIDTVEDHLFRVQACIDKFKISNST